MRLPFFRKKIMTVEDFAGWITRLDGDVTCIKHFPSEKGIFGSFGKIDERLISALKARGINNLYSHQSKAVSLALENRDIVVVTPTASGKTLCYNLPVLDSILKQETSRALYLFPTKALAQDQLTELNEFSKNLAININCYTYDGDTPGAQRAVSRENGHIIITNPDMLNSGILPHHTKWSHFFSNLKYIVVDELHTYRGILGSHMSNLFARLLRICDFYGSTPVFICCSATIANPSEHAEALTGRSSVLISENGAPSPEKKFIIYNPCVINRNTGIRRSSLFETARIATEALCNGISTIVFTQSRLNVELLLRTLRKNLSERGEDPDIITGYRAGYLPIERREIERGLRRGKLRGVISTNALELGIDIGSLDLAVLHGYPGSIASAWQQIGRAGRRGELSLAVMVASALPLDQFLAAKPQWFLGASPELARIDPSNPYIRVGHVRCSAFELPFRQGEKFSGEDINTILDYLAEHGTLNLRNVFGKNTYFWMENSYPAAKLSLRSATSEKYTIKDISEGGKPLLIGSMDRHSAPTLIFPGAIYFHSGRSYIVETLDNENMQCLIKKSATDYYTEGESSARINITDEIERNGLFGWGEALVSITPSMYKKIKLSTHQTIGHGPIALQEEQMKTTSFWITMPKKTHSFPDINLALSAMAHLMRNVAPLFLMCDRGDILVQTRLKDPYLKQPSLFIIDNIPGGVGLAEGAYELRGKLIKACLDALDCCICNNGCPVCTGAYPDNFDIKGILRRILLTIQNT